MTWRIDDPQGFESRKIKYLLPKYTRGRVLEIGCGQEKAFPHFIGYDSGHHFGKGAADIVGDAADLSLFADNSFDAVFSSHVLEHMENMQTAIDEWGRVIKPGGYLCLYVPSANLYPKVGEEGANPDHKHDIFPGDCEKLLEFSDYGWDIVVNEERGGGNEYSILFIARQRKDNEINDFTVNHPVKTACVVRYGGFGDMLQVAAILPGLKAQGFHVTVMTTPKGKDILKLDPNVDDWYIQDTNQVPNAELGPFWHEQAKRYDRFINLSESIEGTLLAIPGRINHQWPKEVRHRYMNRNYFDWMAELAGVDFKPAKMFYPSEAEKAEAEAVCGGKYTILWALAGSSHHKICPHMDAIIARVMLDIPEAQVVLVGDEVSRVLELGWQSEPRVIRMSGKLNIRQTLALAQRADMVIGPETGVVNSVAHEPNWKVVLLSHSSKKNLTQHWYNTATLAAHGLACYPCHQLHYDRAWCLGDNSDRVSECMKAITPAEIWDAVWTGWKGAKKR